jgi:CHASE2 domain-containing sensor protein
MNPTPKWYLPVTVLALLWNLLGCAAYLSDVMLTADDLAQMSAAERALYETRPAWAVAATAIAVWGGAAGCVGLIWRKRWAMPLLAASLAGVLVQDLGLFVLSAQVVQFAPPVIVLQGMVLLIAVALIALARRASARGWIA